MGAGRGAIRRVRGVADRAEKMIAAEEIADTEQAAFLAEKLRVAIAQQPEWQRLGETLLLFGGAAIAAC